MSLRRILVAILALAGLSAGLAYQFGLVHTKNEVATATVHGNIEATVVEVSFKIPGWIVRRNFDEGQEIHEGDVVAELEKADLDADVAARQAEFDAARAACDEAERGSRPEEIDAARAARRKAMELWNEMKAGSRKQEKAAALATADSAAAEMARLKTELDRATRLLEADRGAINQEEYERRQAAYNVAAAKYRESEQRWKLVRSGTS